VARKFGTQRIVEILEGSIEVMKEEPEEIKTKL
jgi:hypothetical protein